MIEDRRITLRCYMNWLALQGLPPFPKGPLQAIAEAGYDGVQFIDPPDADVAQEARDLGLGVCGSGRVNKPEEAAVLARAAKAARLECLTLHVGWGLEDDSEADRLIEAVLEASTKYSIALYPETHRATIFQDMWRTVQFVRRYPSLRFNGDFSHWYTGLEMVYGGFEKKLDFIQPVIERVRFLHGRVGNPGCMQVDIGEGEVQQYPYLQHFSTLWTAVFTNFCRSASRGEYICFATELLGPDIFYARTFRGCEESDRWRQSQVLVRIARECFAHARKLAYGGNPNL